MKKETVAASKRKKKSRRNDSIQKRSELYKLFADLGLLLLRLGHGKSEISNIATLAFRSCFDQSPLHTSLSETSPSVDNLNVVAAAVYKWHRDKEFLTNEAAPMPLPVSGPKQSIETLLSSCDKSVNAKKVARYMLQANLVKISTGRKYVPTSICSILSPLDPMAATRSVRQIRTLIWSLRGNFEPTEHGTLVEREASIRRLPRKHIPAFRDFTRQQGAMFIFNVDDWLETRKATGKRTKSSDLCVEAGAHVFAYVEKNTG